MKKLIAIADRPINGADYETSLGKRYFCLLLSFVFLLAGGTVFTACKRGVETEAKAALSLSDASDVYVRPVAGDCPICGMRLVPIEKTPLFYRNPMNPKVTSPVPMKDEMGMDYVPVHAEDRRTRMP
jgi:hypothetical protein